MWIKKADVEIDIENRRWFKQRFNPSRPFAAALFFGVAYVSAYLLGFPLIGSGAPIPLDEWPRTIAEGLPTFLMAVSGYGALAWVLQMVFGPIVLERRGRTLICTKCFEPRSVSEGRRCECGGDCDPIEYWTWVDKDGGESTL